MFSLMLCMFFFFLGVVTIFLYLLKKQESQFRMLSDEHAQLRVLLRAAESRLDVLIQQIPESTDKPRSSPQAEKTDNYSAKDHPVSDPLLHLSFEEPPAPEKNLELYMPGPDEMVASNRQK